MFGFFQVLLWKYVTNKSHIKTEKWHTLKDPAKYLSTECFPLVKDKMYTNDSFRDTKFGPLGLGLLYCDNSCMHSWTRKDILFELAAKRKIKELDEEKIGKCKLHYYVQYYVMLTSSFFGAPSHLPNLTSKKISVIRM